MMNAKGCVGYESDHISIRQGKYRFDVLDRGAEMTRVERIGDAGPPFNVRGRLPASNPESGRTPERK